MPAGDPTSSQDFPMPKRYVDLTGRYGPGMWTYRPIVPDIPAYEQRRFATVEERGWEADVVTLPTLCGTYLETSKHLFPERPGIAELPPERCFVRATVARIPRGPREHIGVNELEAVVTELNPGDALLVATGWDKHWWDAGGETFVRESPHFDMAAMRWITDRGVSILGGDVPCFDDPDASGAQGVNTVLFGADALILAPLVGLGSLTANRIDLVVLPIKLADACGAPCRAIAIEEA
jgi:kynurenine formamidase